MVLWCSELDPFITVIPTTTASLAAVVLDKPGIQPTVHIAMYLPTSGKETEFLMEVSTLDSLLEEVLDHYPGSQFI